MGVAIYAVIEYKEYEHYFAFSEVDIPRGDKVLPAIIFGDGGITDEMLYPPRGIPPDFSFKVRDLFFTDVETVKDYLAETKFDDEEETTVEDYVEGAGDWAIEQYKVNGLLPMPELYEPSWLNFSELQRVLAHEKISTSELSQQFRAILAAMESLSQDFGAENVRLVFWCGM